MEQGWCEWISDLLESSEHDARERVLNAMLTLKDDCQRGFHHAVPTLTALRDEYRTLAAEETRESSDGEDLYFTGLLQTIDRILDALTGSVREEL